MQDCFRQHPEIYGAELEDDEDEVEAELRARDAEQANGNGEAASSNKTTETVSESNALALSSVPKENAPPAEVPKYPLAGDESGDLIPKASWDAAQAGRPESK
jgi:intermembrane space import and assembly protein 40